MTFARSAGKTNLRNWRRTMTDTITFDEASHAYTVNGKKVPSVTEITSVLTAGKYGEVNAAMLQQAQRRGTEVHELCEAIDCGIDPETLDIAPELVGYVNAYISFLRDYSPEWDYIEKMVWCSDYAGRADRIGRINGRTAILDIKTTSSMDRLSKLALYFQLHGYDTARERMGESPAYYKAGLQLKKDGKYTLHWSDDISRKYLAGVSTAAVWSGLFNTAKLIGGYE
jgi:hypothetical protein